MDKENSEQENSPVQTTNTKNMSIMKSLRITMYCYNKY
jgi:hypothetical protein